MDNLKSKGPFKPAGAAKFSHLRAGTADSFIPAWLYFCDPRILFVALGLLFTYPAANHFLSEP